MSAEEAVEEKSRRRRKSRNDEDEDTEERGLSERKGRATRSRRQADDTEQSGNMVSRAFGGVRGYLRGVGDELDKVVWPSREETIRLSWIVLAATAASAVALGLISFGFTELFVIGIREDRPIVFLIVGVVVVAGYFGFRRFNNRSNLNQPY